MLEIPAPRRRHLQKPLMHVPRLNGAPDGRHTHSQAYVTSGRRRPEVRIQALRWGLLLRRWCAALAIAALGAVACSRSGETPGAAPSAERRELAYRANNVGVALLEQLNYADAASNFRRALGADPTLAIARLNLGVALLYEQDLEGALREAAEAARLLPEAPQPHYILGLAARGLGRTDEARTHFEAVRRLDPGDVGVNINLAQIALEGQRFDDAVSTLGPVVQGEPNNVTAVYVYGLALTRSGNADEGQRFLDRAQALRRASYAITFGTGYLEQGRYAEALASTGAEPDLVDPETSPASFTPAPLAMGVSAVAPSPSPLGSPVQRTQLSGDGARDLAAALGGGSTLLDIDGDGDLDLFVASPSVQRLMRQDDGQWTDVTEASGLAAVPPGAVGVGAVSADIDNDGAVDLVVFGSGATAFYRNDGKGHFTDVTATAGLKAPTWLPGAAALVDVDHDGDVDLLLAGLADPGATTLECCGTAVFPDGLAPAPLQLWRNNGNGTFTDITTAARLERRGHAVGIAPTDFDNDRDVDLVIAYRDAPPALYSNQRDGTFKDVAAEVGLHAALPQGGSVSAVTAGDVNKDEWPDLLFTTSAGAALATSDTRGRFAVASLAGVAGPLHAGLLLDYDIDGLLDLVAWSSDGPVVVRNMGRSWANVTARAIGSATPGPARAVRRGFLAADLDRDGDTDLVHTVGGATWLWSNSGDPRRAALRLDLRGRVSNRSAVGAKVQVRAGSLSARIETSAASPAVAPADVTFGLGTRRGADAARVLWPSGILQAETAAPAQGAGAAGSTAATPPAALPSPFRIEELDRKPSSCPFLYAWNGERFEFLTDFLGGGEMGYWEGPGTYNHPDPVEYVRITSEQLRPRDDRFELKVTNELEEVLYLDRMQLLAVSHPADVQVYPNEGMTMPPKPERLHGVRNPGPPLRAHDDHGHDVTDRVARLDRRYPDDFPLARIRGYAAPHSLSLDLGPSAEARTLLLTGWTDYAFSSDNVAASQAGLAPIEPYLEVRDVRGAWRRAAVAVGIPVGRPQTIPLDLSNVLRPGEHEVRVTTNMRVYWDRVLVGTTVSTQALAHTELGLAAATLRERGFSREVRPDGEDPPGYDYARVSPDSPWKVFAGRYTRLGDVLPLLATTDDQFVVSKPGDEVALAFDSARLGSLPPGWTRTFLLRGDGYSKEMDLNSASPDMVEPYPFHGMTGYPYGPREHYPDDEAHRRYRDAYNTRVVVRPVPSLRATQ